MVVSKNDGKPAFLGSSRFPNSNAQLLKIDSQVSETPVSKGWMSSVAIHNLLRLREKLIHSSFLIKDVVPNLKLEGVWTDNRAIPHNTGENITNLASNASLIAAKTIKINGLPRLAGPTDRRVQQQ